MRAFVLSSLALALPTTAAAQEMEGLIAVFAVVGGAAAMGAPALTFRSFSPRPQSGMANVELLSYNSSPKAWASSVSFGGYAGVDARLGWEGRSSLIVGTNLARWQLDGLGLALLTNPHSPHSVELLAGFTMGPSASFETWHVATMDFAFHGGPAVGVRGGTQLAWARVEAEWLLRPLFSTRWSGMRTESETGLTLGVHPWAKPGTETVSLGVTWRTYTHLSSRSAVMPFGHRIGMSFVAIPRPHRWHI
jgi:hypothetical protein